MASAQISIGTGGLRKVTLRHASGASAEVYLWGATLTSYRDPTGKENIFVSPAAIFDGKKAIRGGIPLVFPQFGQPDKAMPQHGFARVSDWAVSGFYANGRAVCATFALSDNEATRAKWPHAFALEYLVKLSEDSLTTRLRVMNTGDSPFGFNALQHTYIRIPDVQKVSVRGLKDLSFQDKVTGAGPVSEPRELVDVPSFTDRVYAGARIGELDVSVEEGDVTHSRLKFSARLCASPSGAPVRSRPCDAVVWNPYEEASPGDLPPPAFKEFVCVEPGLVASAHELAPGCAVDVEQVLLP